jgi:hypothetical protein
MKMKILKKFNSFVNEDVLPNLNQKFIFTPEIGKKIEENGFKKVNDMYVPINKNSEDFLNVDRFIISSQKAYDSGPAVQLISAANIKNFDFLKSNAELFIYGNVIK